jgi:hypothetical protein
VLSLVISAICVICAAGVFAMANRFDQRVPSQLLSIYLIAAPAAFMLALWACRSARRDSRKLNRMSWLAISAAGVLVGSILVTMALAAWAWSHCPNGVC